MDLLASYGTALSVAVVGASGGIGTALTRALAANHRVTRIFALSRSGTTGHSKVTPIQADIQLESDLAGAAATIGAQGPLHICLIASGMLHRGTVQPEKALRDVSYEAMAEVFAVNTIGPALVMKHFLPLLPRRGRCACVALSARVGSISDNRLGGWHSYRASKAALNMLIRNGAIEAARRNADAIIAGLHPGTVDTDLSIPFQRNVPPAQLFTADAAAQKLLRVITDLTPADSGQCLDYAGRVIAP